jgi:hypothetical protein
MENYWDGLINTIFTDLPDDVLEYICNLAEQMDIAECKRKLKIELPMAIAQISPQYVTRAWFCDVEISEAISEFAIFHVACGRGHYQVLEYHDVPHIFEFASGLIDQYYQAPLLHFEPGLAMGAFKCGSKIGLWLVVKYRDTDQIYIRIYSFNAGNTDADGEGVPFVYEVLSQDNLEVSFRYTPKKLVTKWLRNYIRSLRTRVIDEIAYE